MNHRVTGRWGCYPGSFNPPHVAHLAIAEAAVRQCGLAGVDLVLSEVALGKEGDITVRPEDRLGVLAAVAATRPWLGAVLTPRQLLADIAAGYDVLVMGADKWLEVLDVAFYRGDSAARDEALASLPSIAVAPRHGLELPRTSTVLELPHNLAAVSATAVRHGAHQWMLPEAVAFDRATGAWSDPERYRRWRSRSG